jgi:hypothetical protein
MPAVVVTRRARAVGAAIALGAAAILAVAGVSAAQDVSPAPAGAAASPAATSGEMIVTITHGPVQATLVDAPPQGASIGDVRYFSIPATDDAGRTGRLTASLTTSSIDYPNPGDELRIAQLVFVFGADMSDQLVIGGAADYPKDASTIQPGTATVRPVLGGSGKWAGARGWAESFHLADGTWKHVFHLMP